MSSQNPCFGYASRGFSLVFSDGRPQRGRKHENESEPRFFLPGFSLIGIEKKQNLGHHA